MIYKQRLEELHKDLIDRKAALSHELDALPEGLLYERSENGRKYYYERIPAKGNRKKVHRYGVTRNRPHLLKLVRKEYVSSALQIAESDIKIIERALGSFEPFDENTVMQDFVNSHPDLASGIYRDQADLRKWASACVAKTDMYASNLKSLSATGIQMRSKGELFISSRLEHYNIPFRYEAPIPHPDIPFIPDFTIRRPRDGKLFYWEHFGMVNDEQYMRDSRHKLDVYETYGIVPWDNLIISYDQRDGGINGKVIEALIQGWLL